MISLMKHKSINKWSLHYKMSFKRILKGSYRKTTMGFDVSNFKVWVLLCHGSMDTVQSEHSNRCKQNVHTGVINKATHFLEDLMSPSYSCWANKIFSPSLIAYSPFPKKLGTSRAVSLLFPESSVAFLLFVLIVSKSHHLLGSLLFSPLGKQTPFCQSSQLLFSTPYISTISQSLLWKKKTFFSINLGKSLKQADKRQQRLWCAMSPCQIQQHPEQTSKLQEIAMRAVKGSTLGKYKN